MMGIASLHPSYESLPLPAADGAGLARPGLDPRVARLCVERIAVTSRQFRPRSSTWRRGGGALHGGRFRYPGGANDFGFRLGFHLRMVAFRLDPYRGEFGFRAPPAVRTAR